MRIIGLDLSLTATGVAMIDDGVVTVSTIRSAGKAAASLEERAGRIARLASQASAAAASPLTTADLVVIEQPAFSRTTGHHHDRSGLWWLVVQRCLSEGAIVAEVTPSGLKKYACGKGNADKDAVLLAVARRYPEVAIRNNNEADALILAAMGADHLGAPIATMPAAHRDALDAVRWPQAVVA